MSYQEGQGAEENQWGNNPNSGMGIPPPQQQQYMQQPMGQTGQMGQTGNFAPQSQQQPFGQQGQQFLQGIPNNFVTQVGVEYGSRLLNDGTQYFHSNLNKFFPVDKLKYYFTVNNTYVRNKIKLLLFPMKHKSWERRRAVRSEYGGDQEPAEYLPPRDDVYAPDLYIPVMAFVTYILVVGLAMGLKNTFHPEQLGMIASGGIVTLILEICFLKLGFYLLGGSSVPMFDLVAYTGYKYVGVVLNMIGGLLLGSTVYYLSLLINASFMAIFMIKTLKRLLIPESVNVAYDSRSNQELVNQKKKTPRAKGKSGNNVVDKSREAPSVPMQLSPQKTEEVFLAMERKEKQKRLGEARERIIAALQEGVIMLKHGRRGKPHLRRVLLGKDSKKVFWRDIKKDDGGESIEVSNITEIRVGHTTNVFKRKVSASRPPEVCFSIITKDRTLDLECDSAEAREMWVRHFSTLIRKSS